MAEPTRKGYFEVYFVEINDGRVLSFFPDSAFIEINMSRRISEPSQRVLSIE